MGILNMKKLQKPGDFIKKIFDKNNLKAYEAAEKLGIHDAQIYYLIKEKIKITEKTALKFEKAFGVPAKKLLMMQLKWRLEEARKKYKI
jgi:addiction module HigA family antidote